MPPESIGAAAPWFTRPSAFGPMPAAWVATTYRPDDFYPGFLSNWGKTGVVLSIPTFFGLDLIGYDPAAFQEAALPLPTPGWTWDDFLRTAVQLTKRSGDQVARYGFADKYGMLASQRLSSELASQPDVPISYETMAQVLTWAETLCQRISAAPAPQISAPSTERDYAAAQANFVNLLRAKRLALWSVDMMDDGRRANLVTLPRPDTRAAYVVGGQTAGLVMSGFSQHPEQRWRLISYFSQHTPANRSLIPARRSVAEQAGFWKSLDAASTTAYRYALDHLVARPDNTVPHYAEYVEALYAVVQGQQTATQALAALADKGYLDGAPTASSADGITITTIVTPTPAAGSAP